MRNITNTKCFLCFVFLPQVFCKTIDIKIQKKKKKNPSKPVKFPERKRQSLDYVTELLQSSKKYRKPTEVIWDD